MTKNPKVSIIIPVYNVEKYLKQCLDSVVNQTFKEFEVICIDDGSTDNSGNICDEYTLKDSRIKVIHKINSGHSSSRNKGIEISNAEYIFFLDSDDKLENNCVAELFYATKKYNCDVVFGNYYEYDDNTLNIKNINLFKK